eukprot:CAMPEP_0172024070 /NCGR_PEP_ID=MMETSP1041-20130122/15141_1 /TAXON_ID=464988 /ORGANISM="Hemiselmis andersenii, Strain CCMP439" /LENGTH=219 /DNA_ID=CAMNT_0012679621 /DNA_START=358 /DNA_END=1014 /DNA_ORIENTATION=-
MTTDIQKGRIASRSADECSIWRSHSADDAADFDGDGDDAAKSFVEVRHGKALRHSLSLAHKTAARQAQFQRTESDPATTKDKWRSAMIKRSPAARDSSGWRESTKEFWAAESEKLREARAAHAARSRSASVTVSSPLGAASSKGLSLFKKGNLSRSSSADYNNSSALSDAGTNPSSMVSRVVRKIASKVSSSADKRSPLQSMSEADPGTALGERAGFFS